MSMPAPAIAMVLALVLAACSSAPWQDPDRELLPEEAAALEEEATVIDRDGAEDLLRKRFAELDANGDEEVTAVELMRAGHTYLQSADQNRNGRLSIREFLRHHMDRFDIYDRNGDDQLQASEYREWGLD
jgi:hypothetical protein